MRRSLVITAIGVRPAVVPDGGGERVGAVGDQRGPAVAAQRNPPAVPVHPELVNVAQKDSRGRPARSPRSPAPT